MRKGLHASGSWLAGALLIVTWVASSPSFRPVEHRKSPFAGDFLQEWVGGWIVLRGQADHLYGTNLADQIQHDPQIVGFAWDENRVFPMVYPPFYYVLIAPLAALPYRQAAWIWLVLMALSLAAASRLLAHFAIRLGSSSAMNDWWFPLALLYPPIVESITTNQKSTLCLFIFLSAWRLLDQQSSFAAGLVFGLILFKPQFAIVLLVVMALRKDVRFLQGFFLTAVFFTVISVAVSPTATLQYVDFVTGAMSYVEKVGYDIHQSHCLRAFFHPLGDHLARLFTLVLSLVVLLAAVYAGRRWQVGDASLCYGFASILLATVLISPHLYSYDLTLLSIPIVVFFVEYLETPTGRRRILLLCWVTLMFSTSLLSETIAQMTGLQISVLIMLASLSMLTFGWGIRAIAPESRG